MILLNVHNLQKYFGPEPVLAGVSFEIRAGERVSLVGPNGTGKTTLLRILAGRQESDSGDVNWHQSATCGYLQQQPRFADRMTVWDVAEQALGDLRQLATLAETLAAELAGASDAAEREALSAKFDRVQAQLEQRGGYRLEHRIERVLAGLGFGPAEFRRTAAQLSGGEQNRLTMASLLLAEPDLMLLDEPSNHLDIEATEWLEQYLTTIRSALLVVSHDRYLLDKVTSRTLELFRGTVDSYVGNFTAYQRQQAERVKIQRRSYEKQQSEIAKMEDFVRRHHYGQKHAQAEDRRKKLARIERVDRPREIAAPPMAFPAAERTGDVALRVEHLSKGYERSLFTDLTFDILRGERWGILGPNGCGKSTLLRCLLDREQPDQGRVAWGAHVKVGYFDQQVADLHDNLPVLEAVRSGQHDFSEQARRDLLARFGLAGDVIHQQVGSLSGGERNRTALARLAGSAANFLVLDEPTNHLDLWSRAALEKALQQFTGTILFVTHDRYFLNNVADHLLVVDSGRFRVIDGNYETYRQIGPPPTDAGRTGEGTVAAPLKARRAATEPTKAKRKFPYRKLPDIEADIATSEQRIAQLHADLAAPDVVRDGQRIKALRAELEAQSQSLSQLYEHWEEAMERNG